VPTYKLQAFDAGGGFAFAATLRCDDDYGACAKFKALALGGHRAELWRGDRRLATRAAAPSTGPDAGQAGAPAEPRWTPGAGARSSASPHGTDNKRSR
jgi:hypothetical protein